jgi:AAA15 family ATPase/GTPase
MIEKLHIKNFTCFTDNEFEFSEGINVFIGENGTGKTHLLKLLLWNLNYFKNGIQDGSDIGTEGIWPLLATFGVQNTDSLKREIKSDFEISLTINGIKSVLGKGIWGDLDFNQGSEVAEKESPYYILKEARKKNCLFIPSKEILSFFNGFLALFNRREVSFDGTYQMLAESLDLPPLKQELAKELGLHDFIAELQDILQADVIKENGHFYLKTDTSKTEMNLVAEGWRKIATLIYLILNGELELNKNMVLLIDEPEANLNPKLIGAMSKFLVKLANKGVQIFVATHSYLLSSFLSLYNEYKDVQTAEIPNIKFFGLTKNEDGINVETSDSFTDLSSNSILEEYARFAEIENQFIIRQMKVK